MTASIERVVDRPSPVLSVHKYLPLGILFFFFNSAGLPTGLFYTTMLSPLFLLWLYQQGKKWLTLRFALCLLPFAVAHAINGIDVPLYYARSSLLLWTTYITAYAFGLALLHCNRIDRLFDELIVLNGFAVAIAVIVFFTPARSLFWADDTGMIGGAGRVLRLRLLASEPQVYASLMIPLLIFAVLRALRSPGTRNIVFVAVITIPMLLSQSFGGVSISLAGLGAALIVMFPRLLRQRSALIVMALFAIATVGLFVIPNPILARLAQVLSGNDSSTLSRTVFAFFAAFNVASSKSLLWGVGLGQAKLISLVDLNIGFDVGAIPNAVAGTFAELGIVGLVIRFAVEFYLFFRTRVYRNPFRLAMFVVAFVTQLTGSHLMDVDEYLMWCFAFCPFFPEMDIKKDSERKAAHA